MRLHRLTCTHFLILILTNHTGARARARVHTTSTRRFRSDLENGGWAEEQAMAEKAIQHINAMTPRPKFVVVCGDLVNSYPREAVSQAAEVLAYKHIFTQVHEDICLLCVCGNHDVGNRPVTQLHTLLFCFFGSLEEHCWGPPTLPHGALPGGGGLLHQRPIEVGIKLPYLCHFMLTCTTLC